MRQDADVPTMPPGKGREPPNASAGMGARGGLLFEQAMWQTRMSICLTDPRQPDNPIVFANRAFLNLTGYGRDEVLGRNCRFLQGPDTDRAVVEELAEAVREERVAVVELLNYRKDGSSFWNALHVGPIYDEHDRLVNYFGSQWNVSDVHAARMQAQMARLVARELSHRVKNMFAVIGAMVTLTGREGRSASDQILRIRERIAALGRAHEATLSAPEPAGPAELRAVVEAVLALWSGDGAIEAEGPQARLDSSAVSLLGVVLNDLAASSAKHGALSARDGRVLLDWTLAPEREGARLRLRWRERGGPRARPPEQDGVNLLRRLLGSAGGGLVLDWNAEGLVALADLPVRRPPQGNWR